MISEPVGKPHLAVRGNVGERPVQRADTVRHADQERMQRDRHHSRVLLAFLVEHVEVSRMRRSNSAISMLGTLNSGMSLSSIE